jgi:hypothetical protein
MANFAQSLANVFKARQPRMPRTAAASQTTALSVIAGPVPAPSQARSWTAKLSPPVDGAQLLDDIATALSRHIYLPDGGAETIALFVAHAHAHDAAQISPLLAVVSPEIGCGKTTLLSALAMLTPCPLFTGDLTPAGLYRTIHAGKRTLLMDEAEGAMLGNNSLRRLFNSGHRRGGARVVRADGVFDIWCPKIIALVGELPRACGTARSPSRSSESARATPSRRLMTPPRPISRGWRRGRRPGRANRRIGLPPPNPSCQPN